MLQQQDRMNRQSMWQAAQMVLSERGLPPFPDGHLRPHQLPRWLQYASTFLDVRVRAVDFWHEPSNVNASHFIQYVRSLGFPNACLDVSSYQLPAACAFVAARVVADLRIAELNGLDWYAADVCRATEPQWIALGYALLNARASLPVAAGPSDWIAAAESAAQPVVGCGEMLNGDDLSTVLEGFWATAANAIGVPPEDTRWFNGVRTLESIYTMFARDLYMTAMTGVRTPVQYAVFNTSDCTGAGLHWFTVAYQIGWRAELTQPPTIPLPCPLLNMCSDQLPSQPVVLPAWLQLPHRRLRARVVDYGMPYSHSMRQRSATGSELIVHSLRQMGFNVEYTDGRSEGVRQPLNSCALVAVRT